MPLHVDNTVLDTVEAATLGLVIQTEDWAPAGRTLLGKPKHDWLYGLAHARAFWNLEITVDDQSGADGAPAPSLRTPIEGKAFPAELAQLARARLVATPETEAWFGNDAPALDNTVLEFGDWLAADSLSVRWTAEYDWGVNRPARIPFRFEGAGTFSGITMMVKQEADAPALLSHVLPALDQAMLEKSFGRDIDYGPHMSADRRHWREVVWRPKA